MQLFLRLQSVLFLLAITSVAFTSNLKARVAPTSYYIIRNEWDDSCLASIHGLVVFSQACNSPQAIWIGQKNQTQNIAIQNYYNGKYLAFQPGNRAPQMVLNPANNLTRWTFEAVHSHNRKVAQDRSYWNITYYVVNNLGTGKCLHVYGDNVVQSRCKPENREHLSLEEVQFNPTWYRKPAQRPVPRPSKRAILAKPTVQVALRPNVAVPSDLCLVPN